MDPYILLSYFWFVHEKMFKWNFVFNSLLNGLATYFLQYHVKDVPVGNKVKVCWQLYWWHFQTAGTTSAKTLLDKKYPC